MPTVAIASRAHSRVVAILFLLLHRTDP
jgi:hypothetical protein